MFHCYDNGDDFGVGGVDYDEDADDDDDDDDVHIGVYEEILKELGFTG